MIHINLSHRILHKNIGEQAIALSQAGGAGTLFYSPGFPSMGHNETNTDYEILFFAFPRETFANIQGSLALQELAQLDKFCMYEELQEESLDALNLILSPDSSPVNSWLLQGILFRFLGEICEQFAQRDQVPSSKLHIQDVERQMQVRETILQHIYGNLPKLEELAASVNISPSKLKTDFKSVFGKSIYQYYLHKKMLTARDLLSSARLGVSEVGHQLGYNNLSQFAAQFKKHFGKSPRDLQAR